MSLCYINTKTSWSSLPWQKIYTKISAIQHKIYTATKYCQFNRVQKLQKYLLNSNESKVVSIKYITDKFYLFFTLRYKKKLFISNDEKLKIFKSLYCNKKEYCKDFYFLINQIKQYIVYLSIKPECAAKSICNYSCYKQILKKNFYTYIDYFYNKNNNIKKNLKLFEYLKQINYNKYFYVNEVYKFIKNLVFYNLYWYLFYKKKLFILASKKNKINIMQLLFDLKSYNYIKYIQNILLPVKLNKFISINDNFIFTTQNIKLFYLQLNKIIFYKLKKVYNNVFYKYEYFLFNSKNIHKIFYLMQVKYIYINYCI